MILASLRGSARARADVSYWVALRWGTRLTFPLIVKPSGESVSRGVTLVHDERSLQAAALKLYRDFRQPIVVERQIRGTEWRVLMLANGRFAVYRRLHPSVHGDGRSTVRELIIRRHRRRSALFESRGYIRRPHRPPLLGVVGQTLASQGLTAASVVPRGKRVALSLTQTASIENTSVDETDNLSPAKHRLLLGIVRKLGATRLGFDLIGGTIGDGQDPNILEVNPRSFVSRHEEPDAGQPRPAAQMILEYFLDRGLSAIELQRIADRCRSSSIWSS